LRTAISGTALLALIAPAAPIAPSAPSAPPHLVRRLRSALRSVQSREVIDDGGRRLLGAGHPVHFPRAFDHEVLVGRVGVAAVAGAAHPDGHRHRRDLLTDLLV